MKAICFDLNKTLIEENSWLNLNIALGVKQEEDDMLMDWSSRGIITDAVGQQILLNIYKNCGKHSRQNILDTLSQYNYKDGAKEVIEYLKNNGYTIFLISGAMNILVEMVAGELGVNQWRSNNQFVFDEEDFLKDIITLGNDKDAKLDLLKQLCEDNDMKLTDVYCVGDGDNDIELFKATGKGITFKDSKIKKWALKTITELRDIKKLL